MLGAGGGVPEALDPLDAQYERMVAEMLSTGRPLSMEEMFQLMLMRDLWAKGVRSNHTDPYGNPADGGGRSAMSRMQSSL